MSDIDREKFGAMVTKVEMLTEAISRERHDQNIRWDAYIQANNQRHEENEELNMLRHEKIDSRLTAIEKARDKYFNRIIGGGFIVICGVLVWAFGLKDAILWVAGHFGG